VEGVASAVFVAAVVALITWRVHADVVLVPAVAGLLTFLAVVLWTRTAGRAPFRRRASARRRTH
jgi:hypothetical protein